MTQSISRQSPRRISRPAVLAGILLVLLTVLFSIRTVSEVDLGYHLAGGRWILAHHHPPRLDPFTTTVSDHRYIDLHWLYQVVVYSIYSAAGIKGIVFFHAAIVVLAFLIMIRRVIRTGIHWTGAILLVFTGLLASEFRFSVRPELVSWLLLVILIGVLERYESTHRRWLPAWVPFIMALWVNIQGIFVVGLLVIGAYFLGRSISRRRFDRPLAVAGITGFLACFINPYGWDGVRFPLLLLTRLGGDNPFARTIGEFQSPWTLNMSLSNNPFPHLFLYAFFFLFTLTILLMLVTARRRRPGEWFLVGCFLLLASMANRNIPLLVLAVTPILARAVTDLRHVRGLNLMKYKVMRIIRTMIGVVLVVAVLGTTCRVATGAHYRWDNRDTRFGWTVNDTFLPVRAAAFIRDHSVEGRIFNALRFGGTLIWLLDRKVFIDGRLEVMGETFYREYMSTLDQGHLLPLLDRYHAELAVIPAMGFSSWIRELKGSSDWRLLEYDPAAVVFTRRDINREIPGMAFPPDHVDGLTVPVPESARQRLVRPLNRSRFAMFMRRFYRPAMQPRAALNLSSLAMSLDRPEAAETYLLNALARGIDDEPEIWFRLAMLYRIEQRSDMVGICLANKTFLQ